LTHPTPTQRTPNTTGLPHEYRPSSIKRKTGENSMTTKAEDVRNLATIYESGRLFDMLNEYAYLIDQQAKGEHDLIQYQGTDGTWKNFDDKQHEENTIKDGSWVIRKLYTHSSPAQAEPGESHE
jgi:hypothetical protein